MSFLLLTINFSNCIIYCS